MTRRKNGPGDGSERKTLPPALRHGELVSYLQTHQGATVTELAEVLRVSGATIHRDLEVLAQEGFVERIHGGARVRDTRGPHTAFTRRLAHQDRAKRAIAAEAAKLVEPGWTIFVDSSTTCLAAAEQLATRTGIGLTIVTNSPAIAYRLDAPSIHVVLTPGELNQSLRLIAGSWTVEFVSKLKFRAAFMSGASLHVEQGLGSMTRPLADVLQAVCAVSEQVIALVDSSKVGQTSLATIAPLDRIDRVIIDDGISNAARSEFEAKGARFLIASRSAASRASGTPPAA